MQQQPNTMTIIVPLHPQQGREIAKADGIIRLIRDIIHDIYCHPSSLAGELRLLYTLMPIAVIGGSLLPGWSGHNISKAAAAGCAVLTGFPVGHFSHMVLEMQRSNPLSVLQLEDNHLPAIQ
ncbi:hypothetical protein JHK87_036239 [Glycine soja]|nr:hypothetical protein JHK87_036239 [Glycine soja]